MPPIIHTNPVVPSPELPYFRGGFTLGQTAVPFFSTASTAEELAPLLHLPSQLPFDPEDPVRLVELFQRDLNETRVTSEIVPYLERATNLHFFNAITVVLLPQHPETRRVTDSYDEAAGLAPPPRNDEYDSVDIGPVRLAAHPEAPDQGVLSWNTRLTMPVILDGQHRFRAITRVLDSSRR